MPLLKTNYPCSHYQGEGNKVDMITNYQTGVVKRFWRGLCSSLNRLSLHIKGIGQGGQAANNFSRD